MPIHEYHCTPCDHSFEVLIRSSRDVPHCPRCGETELAKQFSVPARASLASSSSLPVCNSPMPMPMGGGCGSGGCKTGLCGMG